MNSMVGTTNDTTLKKIILITSVVIPIAVAVLIYMPTRVEFFGEWVSSLPAFNAGINTLTALLLILSVIAVKNGKLELHKLLMSLCFFMGSMFLVSYIIYHASVESTVFGDVDGDGILSSEEGLAVGSLRSIYLFVLLSHIILSIVVVPFVLLSFYYSLTSKIEQHKKIVKFSFPIWLYVSVTGVVTYWLISPYY